MAVIESFDSYDPTFPFVPWAIGVARNQVGLYLRRRRRDRLVFNDDAVTCLAVALHEIAKEQSMQLDYLKLCLGSLAGRTQRLFELRHMEDNDLTRFNRDLPGHEQSLPINNLHDGLDALKTSYDLEAMPVESSEAIDEANVEPNRLMVAVKKRGFRGPARVEISYAASTGVRNPVAVALDGYPIYGYNAPNGKPPTNLDRLNGHKDADGSYHYHATRNYPYLNGGFYGEVVERDGQVDPQPRAVSPHPALPPLRDAKITGFEQTKPDSYRIV